MTDSQFFRASVALLVIDEEGYVLAFERADAPGSWQVAQGGLAEGEEPLDTAQRELFEEAGIAWELVTVVDVHPEWLAYELPPGDRNNKTGRGQVQKWVLLRLARDSVDVRLDAGPEQEFAHWKWMPMDQIVATVWEVRRSIYAEVAARWDEHLA